MFKMRSLIHSLTLAALIGISSVTAFARTAPSDGTDNGCYHFKPGRPTGGLPYCGCYLITIMLEPLTGAPLLSVNLCIDAYSTKACYHVGQWCGR